MSPSISGEWQQFTLSGSGVSCWGDVISQGQRTRKGGSRQGAKPPCTRNGPSLQSVPGGKKEVLLKQRSSEPHSAWTQTSQSPLCFSGRSICVEGRPLTRQKVGTQLPISRAYSPSCLPRRGDGLHRINCTSSRAWNRQTRGFVGQQGRVR